MKDQLGGKLHGETQIVLLRGQDYLSMLAGQKLSLWAHKGFPLVLDHELRAAIGENELFLRTSAARAVFRRRIGICWNELYSRSVWISL